MGGWTSLAGSVGVTPSSAQNLWSPRTATTVLAADRMPRAEPPSDPSESAWTKPVTSCRVISAGRWRPVWARCLA